MLTMSAFHGRDFPWHFPCLSAGSEPGWAWAIPGESKEPHQQNKSLRTQERKTGMRQDPASQNLLLMRSNSDIGNRDSSRKNGLHWNEEYEYPLFNEITTILSSL